MMGGATAWCANAPGGGVVLPGRGTESVAAWEVWQGWPAQLHAYAMLAMQPMPSLPLPVRRLALVSSST